ncbi:cupin domain-containing protein [Chitinispirillales bacterium ANBcel5]|uniref:cupin domain-containing protein n=1 Tax=Cellulosispirillum alkaliphilum TaxID=3039283 RepID=UPI002A568B0F|nr:cupin domain-containing protein [Chitinispirillales bacterium ANBcel5]
MYTADFFIKNLNLQPHVEGGYYSEVYRSPLTISDDRYVNGTRNLSTTIYFLLESGQHSKFHSLKSDEIWFYHCGSAMTIHTIDSDGSLKDIKLGPGINNGQTPQFVIQANTIFGAEVDTKDSFSLVSCMVSPGFDFNDFTLYNSDELSKLYPQHTSLIKRING